MGDGAEEKSTEKETTIVVKDENTLVKVNTVVPTHIRRLLYLGVESGVYRSRVDCPRGYSNVCGLGFNYLKAWDLEIFSDEMVEEYLRENKDAGSSKLEERLLKNIEMKGMPKCGWPAPNMAHMAKEMLVSYKGASRAAALFVLAACSRARGPVRPEAYSLVKELDCPEDILLFVKYAMDLTLKHKGWGSGIRRAVKSWYADRFGAMELAEHVTRVRQRHSWSHKDVLKLVHVKSKDAVQAIVLGYALFDLNKARQLFKEVPDDESLKMEAQCVLNYLEAADKLRKIRIPKGSPVECPQVLEAVELIKTHKFTVDHCDDTILMAPKVWEALLEHLTLRQLLIYLPILRFNRIIKNGCELTKVIVVNLKNAFDAFTRSSEKKVFPPVSPALVLISLQTYRRKHCEVVPTKLWFRTHALMREMTDSKPRHKYAAVKGNPAHHGEQKHPRPPRDLSKPNAKVLELLGKILVISIKNLKPTRKRFILGVGNIQDKVKSAINPYVVGFEAAALIYMSLEAAEPDGFVTGFGVPADGKPCRKMRNAGTSLSNCSREVMLEMSTGPIKVDCWLDWLSKEKHSADVIVLMADEVLTDNESTTKLYTAFMNYKKNLNLSKVRLVIVSLGSENLPDCSDFKGDALMVHGFDSNLPFIIQHFARGSF